MAGSFSVTYRDYANEASTVQVHTTEMSAANFDAEVAENDDILAALNGVSLGNNIKSAQTAIINRDNPTPAADPNAQRELKWLVRGYDVVTYQAWSIEVPCADLSLLDPNNIDRMDPTAPEYTALVSALEAGAMSVAGNAIAVNEIVLVGRNL